MKLTNNLIRAVISIVLGILFIVKQGGVIGIAMTLVGICAIVMAVFDLIAKKTVSAIIKAVVGIAVIVFGWVLVDLALFVIAAVLIINGITELISAIKTSPKVLTYVTPAVTLLAGICLLFNGGGAVNFVFIIAGALLIADGVLSIVGSK